MGSSKYNLKKYEKVNDMILFKWEDDHESFIKTKILREKCPCANCEGEKDIFGNIYRVPKQNLNKNSFMLRGIQPVGYYALRPYWEDGHHSGIYSFEFLRRISENQDD